MHFGSFWHLSGKGMFSSVHKKPSHSYTHHFYSSSSSAKPKIIVPIVSASASSTSFFWIKLSKCDSGYPYSVVNAFEHPAKWRRTTEPYFFSHSTHKTTESKVSIFENFKIILRNQSNIFNTTACDTQSLLLEAILNPTVSFRKHLWGKSPRNELF